MSPRPWFLLLLGSILLSTTVAAGRQKRFLNLFFPGRSTCEHGGIQYRCIFSFTCWMSGGLQVPGCGPSALYTCCVPKSSSVRSGDGDGFFQQRSRPFRRPRPPPPPPPPPTPPPSVDGRWFDLSEMFNEQENWQNTDTEDVCGTPRPTLQKRIVGGREARFGELPWQVHIKISPYQCGGALVNRYYVATAAHCIHKARNDQIVIHLGDFDTKDTGEYPEFKPAETYSVIHRKVHPLFSYSLVNPDRYDLALLRLDRPVSYKVNILPICLPTSDDNFEYDTGLIAGWGKTTKSYGASGTHVLHKARLPILQNDECLQWHREKGIHLELKEEMFCAGYSGGEVDACLGDSGGPIIVRRRGRWTLAGIISAGYGCALERQPGIYHNVSMTADWIRQEMSVRNNRGWEPSMYYQHRYQRRWGS